MNRLKPAKGLINGIIISVIFWFVLCLVSTSCAAPAAMAGASGAMDTHTITETSTPVNKIICNSGGLNIRPAPGDLSTSQGWKHDGDIVTVLPPMVVTEDMGLWYELADGGFVNARYLCEVE